MFDVLIFRARAKRDFNHWPHGYFLMQREHRAKYPNR